MSTAVSGLRGYLLRARGPALGAFGAVLISTAAALIAPLVARRIVDEAAAGQSNTVSLLLFAGVGLAGAAAGYFRRYKSNALGIRVQHGIRRDVFEAVQRIDARSRIELKTSQILSRCTTDLGTIQGLMYYIPMLAGTLVLLVGSLVIMVALSPVLTAVMLVITPAMVVIVVRARRAIVLAAQAAQNQAADVLSIAEENVHGVTAVRAYSQERRELERFEFASRQLFGLRMNVAGLTGRATAAILLMPALGQIAVLGVGGWLVMHGRLSLGTFLAFSLYAVQLVAPLATMGSGLTMMLQARAALNRLFEITALSPSVTDHPDALDIGSVRGALELSRVTFGYEPERPVLQNFSMSVYPGETVAIVGLPGSGKSTVAMLLARRYDPDTGYVALDGHDLRDVQLTCLRSAVGVEVEQPFLFRTTVRENIAYGDPTAELERIVTAAQAADADHFIRQLPNGYDTLIGERGVTLSGGQRQRIALARMLLRNPSVLILDDATNATDPITERRILQRLSTENAGRTTVLITARPAAIEVADRIVVLDGGHVIDSGRADELEARCAVFRDLVSANHRGDPDPGPTTRTTASAGEASAGIPQITSCEAVPAVEYPKIDVVAVTTNDDTRLKTILRPLRRSIIAAALLVLTTTMAGLAFPALVRIGIDRGALHGDLAVLIVAAVVALAVAAASAIATYYQIKAVVRASQRLAYVMRLRVLTHLQRLELDYFSREHSGSVLTRFTVDVDRITSFAQTGGPNLFTSALLFLGVLIALFVLNPGLAAVAMAALPVLLIAGAVTRRRSVPAYRRMRELDGSLNSDIQEQVNGAAVTQEFGQQRTATINFQQRNDTHARARLHAFWITAIYFGVVEALIQISTTVALGLGATQVQAGHLTAGSLIAFYLYLQLFFTPVQQLSQAIEDGQQAWVSWRQISGFLRAPSAATSGGNVTDEIRGAVEIRDLSFRYPNNADHTLDKLSLTFDAGQTVALVGATGAGKSTLLKLLARLYEPDRGKILVDGIDILDFDAHQYRRRVGVVSQEPFLFAGSIGANIAYGRPDADPAEILRAIDAVGAWRLLEHPAGLHRRVGDRGSSLSGGERQLVALARAQLINPALLLLDEATSSLDARSETDYLRAIRRLSGGRTALIIAHRLTVAMNTDRVIVIEHGRIVESGTHTELLAGAGPYSEMWEAAYGRRVKDGVP